MARKKQNKRLRRLVARNNERREGGEVFRIETLFSAKDNRHAEMATFLGELPRGEASAYIRRAVWEKMMREDLGIEAGEQQQDSVEVQQFGSYMKKEFDAVHARFDKLPDLSYISDRFCNLDDHMGSVQRAVQLTVRETLEGARLTARERVIEREVVIEPAAVEQASGIDMSRPRKRPTIASTQPVQIEAPDVLTEADSLRLTKMLVESIYNAQPGTRR